MQAQKEILHEVKRAVLQVDPAAEIYFFGSRARGDFHNESDWDFLVLTSFPADLQYKRMFWQSVYPLELKYLTSIAIIVYPKNEWDDYEVTSLYKDIRRDAFKV